MASDVDSVRRPAPPAEPPADEHAPHGDELFRLLVESVQDYAIFMLDPRGRVATWNAGAEKIKGYAKNEIIGLDFSVFYPSEARARRWPQLELELALERGRFEDEGWRVRKDGSQFWANVVIAPVRDEQKRLLGFAKITRDLTARRQVEELQRSERRVDEFLAVLSHELRNPLAPIQSALDILARKPDDLEVARWGRSVIERQIRQLSRLVDDLLDVSRITRGKIELRHEVVDLRAAAERIVELNRRRADERRLQLALSLSDAPLPIRVDPVRLEQIITNLLTNAFKYTNDGGHVSIRAVALADIASLTIADDGIGIEPELLPRVFDLFVQGDRDLVRRGAGLGVGLTLAKQLAYQLGGTLSATSAGVGQGSEFTLAFPMVEQVERKSQETAPSAAERAAPAGEYNVLVVDDNEDAANALAALLEVLGHHASVVHDGRKALVSAISRPPDFVFLDLGLPGMDGIEVARQLRNTPELDRTRLIACTGYGREEDVRKTAEVGFDGHLVKPVTAADLERILVA